MTNFDKNKVADAMTSNYVGPCVKDAISLLRHEIKTLELEKSELVSKLDAVNAKASHPNERLCGLTKKPARIVCLEDPAEIHVFDDDDESKAFMESHPTRFSMGFGLKRRGFVWHFKAEN
jgi:hypothetical protein